MNKFVKLGLNEELGEAIDKLAINEPTEIQKQSIPIVLQGKNIIAQSETGTGKTLAFLLPILEKIDASKKEMQVIILAPTHELSVQINNALGDIKRNYVKGITSTTLVGAGNISRQVEKLKSKPHILIGSAGRILELIKKKKISAHTISTIVIDEGDKLLDYMNIEDINGILKSCQRDTQKLLFSATLSDKTLEVGKKVLGECELIKVQGGNKVNADIEHGYFFIERRDKPDALRSLIHACKPKKAIVFINRNCDVNETLSKLRYHKIKAEALHGTNKKADRRDALEGFRKGDVQVLIASDIAARGLDIKGITHIINLDIPEDSKDYLHRVGRVGRAGEQGTAYSLVDYKEEKFIKNYQKQLKITIPKLFMYEGKIEDAPKKKVFKKVKGKNDIIKNKKKIKK